MVPIIAAIAPLDCGQSDRESGGSDACPADFALTSFSLLPLLSSPAQSQALDRQCHQGDLLQRQAVRRQSSTTRQRYTMVFTPDGKATREPLGKPGDKVAGTWKVVKEGFCTSWKQGRSATCYRLVPNR